MEVTEQRRNFNKGKFHVERYFGGIDFYLNFIAGTSEGCHAIDGDTAAWSFAVSPAPQEVPAGRGRFAAARQRKRGHRNRLRKLVESFPPEKSLWNSLAFRESPDRFRDVRRVSACYQHNDNTFKRCFFS